MTATTQGDPEAADNAAAAVAIVSALREHVDNMQAEVTATLSTLRKHVADMQSTIAALQIEYRRAESHLPTQVADDVRRIKEARVEVDRITTILQGTELFGRYAQDADHHLGIANRWRRGAVGILALAPALELFLALVTDLAAWAVTATMVPVLLLFLYASVESHNHRRREFDRRRIALRVFAVEAFRQQRRDSGNARDRKAAEELLDQFIERHFINPDLDSNAMAHLAPRAGFFRVQRSAADGDQP